MWAGPRPKDAAFARVETSTEKAFLSDSIISLLAVDSPMEGRSAPVAQRPSSHDALEILKRDPAAEFSGPNPNRRRPSQLDQLGVSVPAPDRHGGDAKLFLHLRIGDKRVVGLDEGGLSGHGAAPFLEGTTSDISIQKIVGLEPGTIFAPVFG